MNLTNKQALELARELEYLKVAKNRPEPGSGNHRKEKPDQETKSFLGRIMAWSLRQDT